MSDLTYKRATEEDVDAYIQTEKTVEGQIVYYPLVKKDEALEEIRKGTVYLITKDEVLVGNISYQIKEDGTVYISGLAVDPKYQRQGIAREALNKVLKENENAHRVELVTHPHNTPAIILYLSLGFLIEKWFDNYFGDGEPRILLAREI